MVVLDTSVIIDHLRQSPEKSKLIKLAKAHPKESLAVSVVTIQELYEGESTRDKQKEEHLLATTGSLEILTYSFEIAKRAGELARDLSHPIGLADAAIAATTIINGAQLYTLNKKDFEGIKNLELI